MDHVVELSHADGFGNIYKTPCGVVNVNIKGMTLHLTEDAFLIFSSMVRVASSTLMDRGLMRLMNEEGLDGKS